MHHWGGDFKYFGEVGAAADEIGDFCRRWARIQVTQTKEKYGTARVYCYFGCRDLHSLLYPGYVAIQFPRLLRCSKWHRRDERCADCTGLKRFLHMRWYRMMTFPFLSPLSSLVCRWQCKVYRMAYKRAIAKYPMIRSEILAVADYDELLEGL